MMGDSNSLYDRVRMNAMYNNLDNMVYTHIVLILSKLKIFSYCTPQFMKVFMRIRGYIIK